MLRKLIKQLTSLVHPLAAAPFPSPHDSFNQQLPSPVGMTSGSSSLWSPRPLLQLHHEHKERVGEPGAAEVPGHRPRKAAGESTDLFSGLTPNSALSCLLGPRCARAHPDSTVHPRISALCPPASLPSHLLCSAHSVPRSKMPSLSSHSSSPLFTFS